jgi:putative DNA primase/helicase
MAQSHVDASAEPPTGRVASTLAVLLPHWSPAGVEMGRHTLVRALGGYCARSGWSEGEITALVRALPSATAPERVRQALLAAGQARRGEVAPGWRELEAWLGDRASELEEAVTSVRAVVAGAKALGESLRARHPANDARKPDPGATAFGPARVRAPEPERDERRSDLGNARRLVRLGGHALRHCSARKVWLTWDGRRWADDETGEVMRQAKASAESLWDEVRDLPDDARKNAAAWAIQSQNTGRIAAAVKLAETEPGVAVRVSELDSDPWLLNVQNGTLDLRTCELHEPDPSLLMTKCCGAPYDPAASSGLWDAFVTRLTGGDAELASYLQRALGYALFGAWQEKAFWFGYGPPDGGKSTLFAIVARVLGDYHVAAAASTWMVQSGTGGNRGDVVRLLGARLVTTSEIRQGARVDEETVKRVTGGDRIVAAAKYEGEIEFAPTFALWWFANDPPIIRDDDEGMWSRARVVPFTNPIPKAEQDPTLADKLAGPEHAPAVLAWLVRGCIEWQRQGIGTCAAVDAATRAYRGEMNRLAGFAEERLDVTRDPADEVPNRVMRDAYAQWCRTNNVRSPLQGEHFGRRLRELGVTGGDSATKKAVRSPARPGSAPAGQKDRHWRGVRLRD